MKVCKGCNLVKAFEDFGIFAKGKNGLNSRCKICQRLHRQLWRQNNPEKAKAKDFRSRINQKEKRQEYNRIYKMVYKKEIRQQIRERLKTDINYRLSERLRSRLKGAIKNNYKSGSAVRDLGCSIEEVKKYLESKFQPGMNWENWGLYGWHIDHIQPLSKCDLTDRNEFLKVCHYTNLQPLWAKDNLIKGNKIVND